MQLTQHSYIEIESQFLGGIMRVVRFSIVFLLTAFLVALPAGALLPTTLASPPIPAAANEADPDAAANAEPTAPRTPWRTPHGGDPLTLADPYVWIPVLLETGYIDEAAAAAADALQQYYYLVPVGDANGDGNADYLVETERVNWEAAEIGEDPVGVTLTLMAGGMEQPLWERALPDRSYWYPFEDVNGDNVTDFVVVLQEESHGTSVGENVLVAGAQRFEYAFPLTYEVTDGSTGKPIFGKPVEEHLTVTYAYAFSPASWVDVSAWTLEWSFLVPLPPGQQRGADLVTIEKDSKDVWAITSLTFDVLWRTSVATKLERLDATGKSVWTVSLGDPEWVTFPVDNQDYTGDDIPDWVVQSSHPLQWTYVYTDVGGLWIPLEEARVQLVNGATGQVAWTYKTDPFLGIAFALPGGKADDAHGAILLHAWGSEADSAAGFGTRITRINGATGDPVSTVRMEGRAAAAIQFADVDHDGRDELLTLKVRTTGTILTGIDFSDSADLAVAKSDLSPVWSQTRPLDSLDIILSEYPSLLPDFDADGVPDLPLLQSGGDSFAIAVLSGVTGAELWKYEFDYHRVSSLFPLSDVNRDGGAELGVITFDVPKGADFDTDYAQFPGHLAILRGGDLELIWKKQIHVPSANPGFHADGGVMAWAETLGDTNGNGANDLAVMVRGWDFILEGIPVAQDDHEADGPETNPLSFALLLEGLDGSTLHSYPDEFGSGSSQLGKAATVQNAPEAPSGFLPGFEATFAALGIVASGLLLRHRRKA